MTIVGLGPLLPNILWFKISIVPLASRNQGAGHRPTGPAGILPTAGALWVEGVRDGPVLSEILCSKSKVPPPETKSFG